MMKKLLPLVFLPLVLAGCKPKQAALSDEEAYKRFVGTWVNTDYPGTLAQSQMQAVYLSVFVILIPAIILSGLLFPRNNMPAFTFWYSELLPVTHYLEITRGIIVRGASAASLWASSILPLIILSVGYFLASVLVFRKRV